MTLPALIDQKNKWLIVVLVAVPSAFFYMWANHYPIFEPRELPLTWVDKKMPFLPWTVWTYISEYLFFLVCIFVCKKPLNMNRFLYAFIALQGLSVLIFFVFPTTFPRGDFPLPEGNSLTLKTFVFLRSIDAPTNCFPSLHVGSCYLMSFLFLHEKKSQFLMFFLWATVVAISTLTTKQHYLADVVSGFTLAFCSYWIFFRKVSYTKMFNQSVAD